MVFLTWPRGTTGRRPVTLSVAKATKAKTKARHKAIVNAAKTCKAERAQDAAAFKTTYGTNANKSNAFGRCVSKHAHSRS